MHSRRLSCTLGLLLASLSLHTCFALSLGPTGGMLTTVGNIVATGMSCPQLWLWSSFNVVSASTQHATDKSDIDASSKTHGNDYDDDHQGGSKGKGTRGDRTFEGPKNIPELISLAYDGAEPDFVSLPSSKNIAVANNDSAILKIMDLTITPNPMEPGKVEFKLKHDLTADFPKESTMKLKGWVGYTPAVNTEVDICSHMEYGKIFCPVKRYKKTTTMKQILQVPDTATPGRFSFVAEVQTPEKALIALIAGIVDIRKNGAKHEDL